MSARDEAGCRLDAREEPRAEQRHHGHATKYDANSDSTTVNASAENRSLLTPYRKDDREENDAVVSVDASTGSATSFAPRSAASRGDSPISSAAEDVFENDHGIIDQARESKRQTAQHHRVDRAAAESRAINVARADRGMERRRRAVARKLPRKTRIINDVRTEPIAAFMDQRLDRSLHELATGRTPPSPPIRGTSSRSGTSLRTASTTAIVLVSPPCLSTGRYTDLWPSTRTMLY